MLDASHVAKKKPSARDDSHARTVCDTVRRFSDPITQDNYSGLNTDMLDK